MLNDEVDEIENAKLRLLSSPHVCLKMFHLLLSINVSQRVEQKNFLYLMQGPAAAITIHLH